MPHEQAGGQLVGDVEREVADKLDVREFAAELLKDLNCEVDACESGDDALEKALAQDFDLVFSDIVMPGLSGLQLAQAIEKARPDLPILLATGYSDELVGKQSNHSSVVAKPYDGTTLADAIAAVIQGKRPD